MNEVLVVVYVPAGPAPGSRSPGDRASGDERRFLDECARHCDRRRLRVLAFTHDATTAVRMAATGEVDRIVTARPWHATDLVLPIEVVSNPPDRPRDDQLRTSRRPRWRTDDDDDVRPQRLSRPHWRTQPDE